MAKMVKASDCKCCICGKPAVAFWPCIDPDIPQHPYCRKCLDEQQMKVIIQVCGEEKGMRLFRQSKRRHKENDEQDSEQ